MVFWPLHQVRALPVPFRWWELVVRRVRRCLIRSWQQCISTWHACKGTCPLCSFLALLWQDVWGGISKLLKGAGYPNPIGSRLRRLNQNPTLDSAWHAEVNFKASAALELVPVVLAILFGALEFSHVFCIPLIQKCLFSTKFTAAPAEMVCNRHGGDSWHVTTCQESISWLLASSLSLCSPRDSRRHPFPPWKSPRVAPSSLEDLCNSLH